MIDWLRFTFVTARRYSDLQDKHLALLDRYADLQNRYGALQEERLASTQELIDLYQGLVRAAIQQQPGGEEALHQADVVRELLKETPVEPDPNTPVTDEEMRDLERRVQELRDMGSKEEP